jgi:hypothetical protein
LICEIDKRNSVVALNFWADQSNIKITSVSNVFRGYGIAVMGAGRFRTEPTIQARSAIIRLWAAFDIAALSDCIQAYSAVEA